MNLTPYKVVIRRYQHEGLNGDRSTRKVPYFNYEVVAIREDGMEMTGKKLDGYDGFHCAPASNRLKEAEDFALELSDFLQAELLPMETYQPFVTTSWKKVES
ncbi:hypothetical protein CcrBL47_gp473 [Caulobacter phage BL47]|nr:hypothetical protein CcrBL47_gp473 [Caulobacter phage BL47]UTU10311.1 hypothetical protein CcrRB23_gp449 [Caulobacter phage RB23]